MKTDIQKYVLVLRVASASVLSINTTDIEAVDVGVGRQAQQATTVAVMGKCLLNAFVPLR